MSELSQSEESKATVPGENSETTEDLESPSHQQEASDNPIRLIRAALEEDANSFRPLTPPQRTVTPSVVSENVVPPSETKRSSETTLLAPKQHLGKATSLSKKRGKKSSKSPPRDKSKAKVDAHPSAESGKPEKQKKKKKTKAKEKPSSQKTIDTDPPESITNVEVRNEEAPDGKPSVQKSVPKVPSAKSSIPAEKKKKKNAKKKADDPSPQASGHKERSVEKTRITTRAASSAIMSNGNRSRNGKGGNETVAENENETIEDGDNSVSTAPLPPSLRVQDHHSLRPGAYRMYTGGVARYVNSAGDDMDDEYSTTDYSNSNVQSRANNTIDPPTISARLVVEDETIPPLYRPTTSAGYTVSAHTHNAENEFMGGDVSTMGLASAAPTATTTMAIAEDTSSYEKKHYEEKSRLRRNMLMLVCFVVVLIIVIASIVGSNVVKRMRNAGDGNVSEDESNDEPLTPMENFIAALPDYTQESLAIETSDQSKAIVWMENYNQIDKFPLERQLQRFALICQYYAISSQDPSEDILNLLSSRDECSWYEGKCDSNSMYRELSLQSPIRLVGTIVPELSFLTLLESLLVGSNNLVGTIPTQLGELANLKELRMNDNFFRGRIPTEFGKLAKLEDVDLGTNLLSGSIPTEIGMWNKVHTLELANNTLEGTIPAEVALMTELVTFSVPSNELKGELPTKILFLEKIESVNAEKNFFVGGSFSKLEFAAGSSGKLSSTLKYLKLADNQITGSMPLGIALLTNLLELDLSKNKFKSQLPTQLGDLTKLTSLELHGNRFIDSIPSELGQLSNVKSMSLHRNLFTGTVPFEICELTTLPKEELTVDCDTVFCVCCTCGPPKKANRPPPDGGGGGGGDRNGDTNKN